MDESNCSPCPIYRNLNGTLSPLSTCKQRKSSTKSWLHIALGIIAGVIVILLIAFGYAVEALILHPLRALQHSALALAEGRYDVPCRPLARTNSGI